MMMNAVALVLLVSSLAAAGVWSPQPKRGGAPPSTNGDVLVKEGHRVIVVEYEREGLRPSATSRQVVEESATVQPAIGGGKGVSDEDQQRTEGVLEEVKEKLKEAASVLPNLGQGVSPGGAEAKQRPKICDALGVCKEKISGMFGTGKEKVADVHDRISSKAEDMEASVKEAARKAVHGGDDICGKLQNASEKQVEDVVGGAKIVKDSVADAVAGDAGKIKHGASEIAGEVAGEAKEQAQHAYERVKEKAQEVKEKAKDAYGRTEAKAREAGDKVQKAAERAKDALEEGRRNITDIIQRGRDVLYDAAMYAVSRETVGSLMRLLHSLAFSVVYGTCFWVTFMSSHVLARALPRQQFGVVQSKIYPVYFRTMAYSIGICLITHYLSCRWASANRTDKLQAFNLLASFGFVLVNMLFIEPRATKVMYDRLKLEKEEGRGRDIDDMDEVGTPVTAGAADAAITGGVAVEGTTTSTGPRRVDLDKEAVKSRLVKMNKRLKNLNSYSSLMNMVSLMGLSWHLVYLSQRQHHHQLGGC